MKGARAVASAVVVIGGLAAGVAAYEWLNKDKSTSQTSTPDTQARPSPATQAEMLIGSPRPAFVLPDLEGEEQAISQWDDRVVVLNFWATWCPPCRREIPAFIELQERYGDQGLQIVGIAIDQLDLVREYAEGMFINYPVLVGEAEAIDISARYGNRFGQLPYTVFINREGRIEEIRRGEVEKADADEIIKPLL